MRYLIFTLLICLVSPSFGQFNREVRAERLMQSQQFAKAFEYWRDLSLTSSIEDEARVRYMQKTVMSAQKAGFQKEALVWSLKLLQMDGAESEDFVRAIKLMRFVGLEDSIPRALSRGMSRFPNDKALAFSADNEALLTLQLQDTMAFTVTPFRPHSIREEFASTPFQGGLVFMTTGVEPGLAPVRDVSNGRPFTELAFIPNVNNPEPNFSWIDQAKERDLFLELGLSRAHDGPVSFDRNQDFAVLTRSQRVLDSTKQRATVHLQLEFFWKKASGWEPAQPFPWNASTHSSGHGTFDSNEDLIFSSDRPGGYGGMDLYRCIWDDDQWNAPENLGASVNSSGNEVFPFVSEVGTLFFASDGWGGAGGLDVFYGSIGAHSMERLGVPINSHADDFAFQINEESGEGWLSSNRLNSKDAIYRVEGSPLSGVLNIRVRACDGLFLPGATVLIMQVESGSSKTIETDEAGMVRALGVIGQEYELTILPFQGMVAPPSVRFEVPAGALEIELEMNYAVKQNRIHIMDENGLGLPSVLLVFEDANAAKQQRLTDDLGNFQWNAPSQAMDFVKVQTTLINYEPLVHHFKKPLPECLTSISDTIRLSPEVDANIRIDLDMILYDLGSADLRALSKLELDKLVLYLKERQDIRVELSSHTDCRSDDVSNLELSQARAESCVQYIVSMGIDERRIVAKGFGEERLLNDCSDLFTCGCASLNVSDCIPCTENLHQENRRTELRLLAD